MTGLRNYRDLDTWQAAMRLVEMTYALTCALPDNERYGLVSQMRRSATSVPSNVAEGQARGTPRFGLWYLRIAIGSAAELDTQVELARRLGYVTTARTGELDQQLERVRQMLYGMRREHERRIGVTGAAVALPILFLFLLRTTGFFA